ncbi:MAG TPA: dephospho-CoA kinase [Bacteroidota bacterium]|nr:dephospho-CoA kinase [Bacteroidota bacterium]
MIRVGITGGMASGKSEVCEKLRSLGVSILSADLIAHQLTDTDPKMRRAITLLFGPLAYDTPTGTLNRSYVGRVAFADKRKLSSLNKIVHPQVLQAIDTEVARLEEKKIAGYAAIEAALLFESGLNRQVDYVLTVVAQTDLQIERGMNRDKLTEAEVRARLSQQLPAEATMNESDFVLYNNSTLDALYQKTIFFHRLFTGLKPRLARKHDNL